MTLEKLAEITNKGFDEVRTHISNLKKGQDITNTRLTMLEEGQEIVSSRLTSLEEGQETILLRLDHHAYKMDVEDLKRRVTRLEEGEGI